MTPDASTNTAEPAPVDIHPTSNVQSRSVGQGDSTPDEPHAVNQEQTAVPSEPARPIRPETTSNRVPMSPTELARYAAQVNIAYPATNGADLYGIAEIVPRWRRDAFEEALGEVVKAYYEEVARQGHEPDEHPIPDVLTLYVLPGLVTAAELHAGYQRARAAGHGRAFIMALQTRNAKAAEVLKAWLAGQPIRETVVIDRRPLKPA